MEPMTMLAILIALLALGLSVYMFFQHRNHQHPAVSLMHLAELDKLHPELKDIYKVHVVDTVTPAATKLINRFWSALPAAKKKEFKDALTSAVKNIVFAMDGITDKQIAEQMAKMYMKTQPPKAYVKTQPPKAAKK